MEEAGAGGDGGGWGRGLPYGVGMMAAGGSAWDRSVGAAAVAGALAAVPCRAPCPGQAINPAGARSLCLASPLALMAPCDCAAPRWVHGTAPASWWGWSRVAGVSTAAMSPPATLGLCQREGRCWLVQGQAGPSHPRRSRQVVSHPWDVFPKEHFLPRGRGKSLRGEGWGSLTALCWRRPWGAGAPCAGAELPRHPAAPLHRARCPA